MSINGLGATYSALNGLTEQIAQSVKNIKAQSVKLPEYSASRHTAQSADEAQAFTLNSYAVSYLSPNSLYSVHKIAAEQPEELPNRQQKQVLSNPDGQENTTQIEEGALSGISFSEELDQVFTSVDYAKVSAIYRQNFVVNAPDVSLLFQGTPIAENSAQYVSDAYQQASELTQTEEPTIELMHKNNQQFDYKIWNN